MDSYNRFNRCVFEWQRTIFKIVGHDFFGETFERNFVTFIVYVLLVSALLAMLYTAIFYDALTKIFILLFFLIALQVIQTFQQYLACNQFSPRYFHSSFLSSFFSFRILIQTTCLVYDQNISHSICRRSSMDDSLYSGFL